MRGLSVIVALCVGRRCAAPVLNYYSSEGMRGKTGKCERPSSVCVEIGGLKEQK